MICPIDIEEYTRLALAAGGFDASAVPLPDDFTARLPFALVTRTGGQSLPTSDQHLVSIDVYADTWATATSAANECVSIVRAMRGDFVDGVAFYDVGASMPYVNPDPNNEYVPRMTFTASITAAGKEV